MSKRQKNPDITWHYDLASADTMTIPAFRDIFSRLVPAGARVADPFARNCRLGSPGLTNDIDEKTDADMHMDIFDFLDTISPGSLDVVILDPPFSFNQASRLYKKSAKTNRFGVGWVRAIRKLAGPKLKKNGLMFCLGWDAHGRGDLNRFDLTHVVVVCHGGGRNATILTVDKKL